METFSKRKRGIYLCIHNNTWLKADQDEFPKCTALEVNSENLLLYPTLQNLPMYMIKQLSHSFEMWSVTGTKQTENRAEVTKP